MPRRQPYAHNVEVNAGALEPLTEEAFSLESGGLEITLDDADLNFSEAEPSTTPAETRKPDPEPQPVSRRQPEPEPQRNVEDEAYTRLKAQLEREQEARRLAEKRAKDIEQDHTSVQDRLRQERERSKAAEAEHVATQEAAIDNAMRVAEREADQAQEAIARAMEAGDFVAAAKAQRILSQADNDLSRLREGKSALALQKSQPKSEPAREPEARQAAKEPSRADPESEYERVEAYITQSAHTPRVQKYMRDHYDDLFSNGGARTNKLVAGHWEAKAAGVVEGSEQYFKFLDRHMGYDKSDSEPAPQPRQAAPAPTRQKQAMPPAAPVSRGSGTDNVTGTSVTLTKAQVQFCRESNIDPKDYARSILKMRNGAKDPSYTGPRFTSDL